MLLGLSLPAFQAAATVLHFVAWSLTTFRLYRRFKTKNLWWDDHWAFFSLVMDFGYFPTIWMRREVLGGADADATERQRRIALFWMTCVFPPLVVWSARTSICFSIARIDIHNASVRVRPWVYILTIAFGLMAGIILFQKVYVCSRSIAWHYSPNVQCVVGKAMGYISLICDLLADTVLTLISFNFLWKLRMRQSRRRLLSWLFAANTWSSLAGIVYAVMVLCGPSLGNAKTLLIGLGMNIKTSITLTVCNLLVVVTYIYTKFWSRSEDSDSESEDAPTTGRHRNLPSGRTTKSAVAPQSVVLSLTEFDTDSTGFSSNERARGITSTFMTWAGSKIGWVERAPPSTSLSRPTNQGSASVSSALEGGSQPSSVPSAVSEPSLYPSGPSEGPSRND